MQNSTLWRTLLGVDKTIVEAVNLDVDTGILVASVATNGFDAEPLWILPKTLPL